jgi:hypothetical protein
MAAVHEMRRALEKAGPRLKRGAEDWMKENQFPVKAGKEIATGVAQENFNRNAPQVLEDVFRKLPHDKAHHNWEAVQRRPMKKKKRRQVLLKRDAQGRFVSKSRNRAAVAKRKRPRHA